MTVRTELPDQQMVVEAVKMYKWPPPTLAAVKNNIIKVTNTTNSPVLLDGKNTLSLQLTPTINSSITDPPTSTHYYGHYSPQSVQPPPDTETIQLIKFGKTEPELKATLDSAHRQFREVFNKDLSNGSAETYCQEGAHSWLQS